MLPPRNFTAPRLPDSPASLDPVCLGRCSSPAKPRPPSHAARPPLPGVGTSLKTGRGETADEGPEKRK